MRKDVLGISFFLVLSLCGGAEAASQQFGRMTEELRDAIKTYNALNEKNQTYDVTFRRDPMRPLVDHQGNILSSRRMHEGLWVQGVIWSEEHPLAVIEDELYTVGDVVDDYTIREIHPDKVIVQHGDTTQTILLDRGIKPGVTRLD